MVGAGNVPESGKTLGERNKSQPRMRGGILKMETLLIVTTTI
jgi:hypothetical protein